MTGQKVIAELRGVSKSFGGTVAVDDVSFELRSGEVLALLGENGAGKSTCVKLLAGVYRPDRGHTFLEGYSLDLHSPLEAHRHGIAVMHQHPGLFDHLSIAENIFVSNARKSRWGWLDHSGMNREASRLLEVVGLSIDPDVPLGRLRTSERQLVEIAKSLAVAATGKKGETFAAGRLGNFTIGENGEVILGPAVIVTPENVETFKF